MFLKRRTSPLVLLGIHCGGRIRRPRTRTVAVINYGASWCGVCSQILPTFCELSGKFLKVSFVYADIDECPETTQHIRYTPTFHFYIDGERVDEMFGVGEEHLQDRLWLHS
ncbi:thioredoxin-like 3-3 [Primulina eburnea]|uniref:thioredoxin-like 3-3 n=1 Tax=Primulina eburnea TaxID=1245227 RepID=UPI003C6C4849